MGTSRFRPVASAGGLSLLLVVVMLLPAMAHQGGEHADPELLNHWRTQVHLLFQWGHLVAFGLWVGGILAALRLPRLPLDRLLYGSWGLFLVSLGTGTYNMEFGAATPEPPDILSLPALWGKYDFGAAYIILVGIKQGLFALAVLLTLAVTVLHVRWALAKDLGRLRRAFLGGSAILGLALAAVTCMVLVLHEAIDLAPTPLHSLGGVAGAEGPEGLLPREAAQRTAPPPYGTDTRTAAAGFRLLTVPQAAADVLARFGHLVGFALWLGGTASMLLSADAEGARRVVPLLWLGMALQGITGAYQLVFWTPFAVVPLPGRLSEMQGFRFGYTYTLLLAAKLGLVGLGMLGTAALTLAARRATTGGQAKEWARRVGWMNLAVGLALAYVVTALLLVHEAVDHAL